MNTLKTLQSMLWAALVASLLSGCANTSQTNIPTPQSVAVATNAPVKQPNLSPPMPPEFSLQVSKQGIASNTITTNINGTNIILCWTNPKTGQAICVTNPPPPLPPRPVGQFSFLEYVPPNTGNDTNRRWTLLQVSHAAGHWSTITSNEQNSGYFITNNVTDTNRAATFRTVSSSFIIPHK
jgi:hypothetical protein